MPDIKPIHPRFHLEVLGADELEAIRSATLHILQRVGVHFPSRRALHVFAEHGAQVDMDSQIVRLSPELVTGALSRAPRSFVLSGRARGTDLVLDGSSCYFGTDGCGTETVDFETGERRRSCKADVARMARVADAPFSKENPVWAYGLVVEVTGERAGRRVTCTYRSKHPPQEGWGGESAYFKNVGIPLSIGAQLVAHGQTTGRGVLPPERAFPTAPFFAELARREITVEEVVVEEGGLA